MTQIKIFGPDAPEKISSADRKAFESLNKRYREDAGLQAQYGHLYAFLGANGVDVPSYLMDPPVARPDVDGYITSIKGNTFTNPLTPAEKDRVETYASTWQVHADIRKEFRTFPAYASYMRASERGLVKHYGNLQ